MLLRVLAGLSRPDGGAFELAGLGDPSSDGWRRRVAYVAADPGIPTWLSPRDALRVAVDLLGLSARSAERAIASAAASAGIRADEIERRIVRGGRSLLERVALATALVGDPEVLLLDDPLRSLPPAQRAALLSLPGPRRTVLVTSTHPAALAGICSHVALLRDGKLALLTAISRLQEHDLPLSAEGLEALANLPRRGR
jgi:ABC-2 type transport system ATP-binding protein